MCAFLPDNAAHWIRVLERGNRTLYQDVSLWARLDGRSTVEDVAAEIARDKEEKWSVAVKVAGRAEAWRFPRSAGGRIAPTHASRFRWSIATRQIDSLLASVGRGKLINDAETANLTSRWRCHPSLRSTADNWSNGWLFPRQEAKIKQSKVEYSISLLIPRKTTICVQ